MRAPVLLTAILVATFSVAEDTARADDWPQWRGPGRDGVWRESGVVERFEQPQLELRWRAEISGG
ncbi:MAG: PQQ-binding-like beta-propeller repeat protein, partial [Planctomycetota bacterium]